MDLDKLDQGQGKTASPEEDIARPLLGRVAAAESVTPRPSSSSSPPGAASSPKIASNCHSPSSPGTGSPPGSGCQNSEVSIKFQDQQPSFTSTLQPPCVGIRPDAPYASGSSYVSRQKESITVAMQQGVDENIYHWKVLNLSRAKLKASSRTSALLSGFAMVAMVEIQIDKVPTGLLVTFAVCTVLLIAVHMLALMISTCILPNVEAVANLHFQTQKTVFESPHLTMNVIVELAWGFSTVVGILLFLVEIAILCWVKFYSLSQLTAWVATGLLIPIIFIFIAFASHFYLKLVAHKSEVYEGDIKELEKIQQRLDVEVASSDTKGPSVAHIV